MKKLFLLFLTITNHFICFGQDSSKLPQQRLGKSEIYVFRSVKYLPEYLQKTIDSINGSSLKLYDIGEKVFDKNKIPQKAPREFRRLDKYSNAWLLTYLHRGDKNHIHFIVFTPTKQGKYKVTAGISEYDIDSISTLQRRKNEKSITFIDLRSKKQKHKF